MEIAFSQSHVFSLALAVMAAVWIFKYGSARKTGNTQEGNNLGAERDSYNQSGLLNLGRVLHD